MNTLIIDALFVGDDQKYSEIFDFSLFTACKSEINVDRVILLQNGHLKSVPENVKNVVLDDCSVKSVISSIIKESRSSDSVIIFRGGNPYLDLEYIKKMLQRHNEYFADYTYSLGYPDGFVPEIVNIACLKNMLELVEDCEIIKRDYIFFSISKDINSFDIETFISPKDLRLDRLSFGLRDKGEYLFTKSLLSRFQPGTKYDEIVDFLYNNKSFHFSTMYSAFIELTNVSTTKPIYYPDFEEAEKIADVERLKKIATILNSINPAMKIVFSGVGDPLKHKDIIEIADIFYKTGFSMIIETDGYMINDMIIEKMLCYKDALSFVVKVDAVEQSVYKIIHKSGDINVPIDCFNKLKKCGFTVYRQVVRMNENEAELEKMVRNKDMDNLIIRKYSTYCDKLHDNKVVDLSPLHRFACYHVRRDLSFDTDMNVKLCMYSDDILLKYGSFDSDKILSVMRDEFSKNAECDYRDCCKKCDDYYTFNF